MIDYLSRAIKADPSILVAAAVMVAIVVGLVKPTRAKPVAVERAGLDAPLFMWNTSDTLTGRNLLSGGIHAFGRTDAGKTSSMKGVARAIMRANSSMLILCAKRNEYRDWLMMALDAGRKDDAVLIEPQQGWRFNMVGYESQRDGEGGERHCGDALHHGTPRAAAAAESKHGRGCAVLE